jgi:thiol:disulfide interchange protein DsbA
MRAALVLFLSLCVLTTSARAETLWVEGQHYFLVEPAQPTGVPRGKVEVVEVFSYACPACNLFYPVIDTLKAALPARAQLRYLPASWHPEEGWKTFQRAFFAAQSLGLVNRTHAAVFDAIWKSGELATVDPATHNLRSQLPTIVDVAKFYGRIAGVKPDDFLAAAHSFSVDASMKQADAQIRAYQADVTPTIIVNGKYRLTPRSAGDNEQFISLVKWLVNRELK